MRKIFQIGFHVCGTRSLADFFEKNKFKVYHNYNGILAQELFENLADNKTHFNPPLEGPYRNKQGVFYSDMEYWKPKSDYLKEKLEAYKLFKEIDAGYPGSLFILNTRNGWVDSKIQKFKKYKHWRNSGYNENQVRQYWSTDWNTHLKNVRDYFQNRKDFLEYNINTDNVTKLVAWLQAQGFTINYKNLPKVRG